MPVAPDAADRRHFLHLCVGAIGVTLVAQKSNAADLPHLEPTDPTAQALGYVEDASAVDPKKYPQHQPTQSCANCQQFTQQSGSDFGACLIFAGKAVGGRGWCGAYVAKA